MNELKQHGHARMMEEVRLPGAALATLEKGERVWIQRLDADTALVMNYRHFNTTTVSRAILLALPDRPVFNAPAMPEAGVVAYVKVNECERTQNYEVAAWFTQLKVPAQTVELRKGQRDQHSLGAYGMADARAVYDHLPSLYGGVAVANTCSGPVDRAERVSWGMSLLELERAYIMGDADVTQLGWQWIAWAEAYVSAYEAHKRAMEAWEAI